jgi:molybdate transport system permease protein
MSPFFSSEALILTMQASFFSLFLQLVIGTPIGLYLACKKTILSKLIDVLVTTPMILPPMALGFFLILIVGKNGLLGNLLFQFLNIKILFSFWGVLIALFIVGLPFMVKSVQSARQQVPTSIVEAAHTMGKKNTTIVFKIILPNIQNGIVTGLLLAFGRYLGEVGISLMLGGNIIGRTETVSLAIYNAVFEGNFGKATKLSLLLSGIAILVLVVANYLQKKPTFHK